MMATKRWPKRHYNKKQFGWLYCERLSELLNPVWMSVKCHTCNIAGLTQQVWCTIHVIQIILTLKGTGEHGSLEVLFGTSASKSYDVPAVRILRTALKIMTSRIFVCRTIYAVWPSLIGRLKSRVVGMKQLLAITIIYRWFLLYGGSISWQLITLDTSTHCC